MPLDAVEKSALRRDWNLQITFESGSLDTTLEGLGKTGWQHILIVGETATIVMGDQIVLHISAVVLGGA